MAPLTNPSTHISQILVVDDNEVNRDILGAYLKRLGCEARLISSGAEALQVLKETLFDLILMDCQMPQMNGFDTTRAIRAQSHSSPHIPIVGVTASDTDDVKESCRTAGMDDVVGKPITIPALQDILARWVSAVDQRVLKNLHEELDGSSSSDIYQEAVAIYLQDAPIHVAALKEAAQQAETERMRREVHIIKGSSSYFGAHRLESLCQKLEKLSETNSSVGVPECVSALQEEFQRVRKALEAERLTSAKGTL